MTFSPKSWAAVAVALSLSLTAAAAPAAASITNTRADAPGTVELSASSWLAGAGVDVYSNGSSSANDAGRHYTNGIYDGQMWQCVELIDRLYLTKGWITSTWFGNGNQLYANAPTNLTKQTNGSITYLNPGDVITLDDGGYGHAGIVNTVNGTTVQIVNQNTGAVYSTATWTNGRITMNAWTGYSVQGIIHAPRATPPPGQTGGTPSPAPTVTKSDRFNGDPYSDLAIVHQVPDGGADVHILYGSTGTPFQYNPTFARKLAASNGWNWSQMKLSSGDYNNDGFDDIAVVHQIADGGADVHILYGSTGTPFQYNPTFARHLPASEGWNWSQMSLTR